MGDRVVAVRGISRGHVRVSVGGLGLVDGEGLRRGFSTSGFALTRRRVVLLARPLRGVGVRAVGIVALSSLARSHVRISVVPVRERGWEQARRNVDVVGFTPVAWDAIHPNFDLGRIPEVRLVQVFRTNGQRRQLGQRRWRTEAALLDVLDLVVRDQVLCDPTNGERERL